MSERVASKRLPHKMSMRELDEERSRIILAFYDGAAWTSETMRLRYEELGREIAMRPARPFHRKIS